MRVDDDLLTIEQVCAVLKIGKTMAYSLVKRRELKGIKIGKRIVRVPKSALDAYLASLGEQNDDQQHTGP